VLWTNKQIWIRSLRPPGKFVFTTASRTALGPTQPPIQWGPGALSLGVKRPGREADHSPTSSAEIKELVELYIPSHNKPSWRGAQFKKKAQGRLYSYIYLFGTLTWWGVTYDHRTQASMKLAIRVTSYLANNFHMCTALTYCNQGGVNASTASISVN